MKLAAPIVTGEEKELRRTAPPPPRAGELLSVEQIDFQLKLIKIREAQPKQPKPPHHGTIVLPSSSLLPSVAHPRAHGCWRDPLAPRQWMKETGTSGLDQFRASQLKPELSLGGLAVGGSKVSEKMPPQPTSASDYFECTTAMKPFMTGTHRWSATEAAQVDIHVAHVMSLFSDHPAAEVMMYDDDFRLARHRLQDHTWAVKDDQLLQKHVRDPVTKRAAAAAVAAAAAAVAKPPRRPPADPKGGDDADGGGRHRNKALYNDAFKVHTSVGGKDICRNFNWAVGTGPCAHGDGGASCKYSHNCYFCAEEHPVHSCEAYKTAHPSLFTKGKLVDKALNFHKKRQ